MFYFKVFFSRIPLPKKVYPDPTFLKYFSWSVKKDPKGLKKVERLPPQKQTNLTLPSVNSVRLPKKKKKDTERVRRLSVLRSSPSGPGRGRRGRGRGAAPGSPQSPAAASDLRSPPRRAPTVPGLAAALASASPVAASPNADTPARRRASRRRGLLRCRNRNQGCTDNVTFTTEDARNHHERFTCRALSQVNSFV